MRKSGFPALLAVVWVLLGAVAVLAAPASGWLNHWKFRVPAAVTNPAGFALSEFQVKIVLDGSFNFAGAQGDGSDLRVTAADGSTLIPFWIERWNPGDSSAILWARVPSIPVTGTTIYLYYGNPGAGGISSGDATFEFFDDFESPVSGPAGYFPLGSAQTVLVTDQGWETTAPHSLSVIQRSTGGHTYWGYYALQDGCGGVGVAYSEDLVSWTKDGANPLFTNGRWPSVIQVGSTLYMAYTKDYCTGSRIVLATSTDGIVWNDVKTLVTANYLSQPNNQNPNLWHNPNDNQFYLYWYNGNNADVFHIMVRSAVSPEGLDNATGETTILTSSATLAAPNIMYYGGTYFLSTETRDTLGEWNVVVHGSQSSPVAGFSILPNNPVLANGSACMFQHIFGANLHVYYCKLEGGVWRVDHRSAPLNEQFGSVDPSKWTASGGAWPTASATQPDATAGRVAQGSTSGRQILYSSFSGADYVLEAFGKQMAGNVWGVGFRVQNPNNFYSANLYENLDGGANLYSYAWIGNDGSLPATVLGSAATGTVDNNVWYKLTVKVQSNAFDIFKDDVLQLHTADSNLATGGIALYGEAGTTAQFDRVLVRKVAVTDPAVTPGPAQRRRGRIFESCIGQVTPPTLKPNCHAQPHFPSVQAFGSSDADRSHGHRRDQVKHQRLDYRDKRGHN